MSFVGIILSLILMAAIGVALLQAVNTLFVQERQFYHQHYYRDILLVDVVVLIMYVLVAGMVAYIYIALHYEPVVLLSAMILLVGACTVMLARHLWSCRDTMEGGWCAAFAVWFALVLYLTLFSRVGSSGMGHAEMTPFRSIAAAIEQRSLAPLNHMFLNVLMFVPLGFIIPHCNPQSLSRAGFSILGGLISSTVIEALQMLLRLGYCDIDDILANALGAVIGYALYCLLEQTQKNWRIA